MPARHRFAALAAAALLLPALAAAQANVYRWVDKDGKVHYSDTPPPEPQKNLTQKRVGGGYADSNQLPYATQVAMQKSPVTLYTGNNCTPCVSARNLLMLRGVPFTERTVNSNEDIDALQRLSGSTSLPFGTIGGQQLLGFSDGDWTQYLDAAGYPKQSRLPKNYRQPAATPLVAPQPPAAKVQAPADDTPAAPTTERARRAPPPPPPPGTPTPSNPAGIRF